MGFATPLADRLLVERPITTHVAVASIQGGWSLSSAGTTTTYYNANEVHLYTTGAYRYVGCSYAEARKVAQALAEKLVFKVKYSYWGDAGFVEDALGEILQADIAIVKQNGHLYDVAVIVNADDVRMRLALAADQDYSSLFTDELARDWTPTVEVT